jgi:hypothetical protein
LIFSSLAMEIFNTLRSKFLLTLFTGIIYLIYIFSASNSFYFNIERQTIILCGKKPLNSEIRFDHKIWQVLKTSQGNFNLLNAYLDTKINKVKINCNGPLFSEDIPKIYCRYWYNGNANSTVKKFKELQRIFPGRGHPHKTHKIV